jgi:acetyltransferase-like isoleucine patch superfamily enzyme
MNLYRTIATSDHFMARSARQIRRSFLNFCIPAPKPIFLPLLWIVLGCRHVWYFVYRVFVCEPLFKAYCHTVGKNVHTGVFFHYVVGRGDIILEDNVVVDGKVSFLFAARLAERPTLIVGRNTGIGHECSFTVGKRITIGKNCRIANGVRMFDSPGHALRADKRKAGLPPDVDDVRPITIADNVWIGIGAVIYPGVTIGENSIVSTMAVVMSDVPPNTMVAGNPARKMLTLDPPSA